MGPQQSPPLIQSHTVFCLFHRCFPLSVPQILPSGREVHTRFSKHLKAHQLLLAGDFVCPLHGQTQDTEMSCCLGSLWWFLLSQDSSAKPRSEFWRIWQKRQDGLWGNLSSLCPNKAGFSQPFLWEYPCLEEVVASARQLLAALRGP